MFKIGKFNIGSGRCFIIAEAGVNHNGDPLIAKKMVKAAYESGADAIKFQSFRAEIMCGLDLKETKDVEAITGGTRSSYEMYKALEIDDKSLKSIYEYASKLGILCFSSVFDPGMVDMLVKLKSAAVKISSGDVNYFPLIEKAAKSGLPVIVSTGMATFEETVKCYDFLAWKSRNFALLHCVSEYPAPPQNTNLLAMRLMKKCFNCPVGFSDHSAGIHIPIAAASLGADIIEKHFTLDNSMPGPDQKLSLNPPDFSTMVSQVRDVEKALGVYYKNPTPVEWKGRHDGRRGMRAARFLKKGIRISARDVKIIKPACGLAPEYLDRISGNKLNRDIPADTPLSFDMFESGSE